MALTEKYQSLIDMANQKGVSGLSVKEQDNVLYIVGTAPSEEAKQALWNEYGRIDPDYRSGDLMLNIEVPEGTGGGGAVYYTVQSGDSLSKIAANYGIKWQDIFEANKDQIKNPDLIHPGQKFRIPQK